MRSIPYWTNTVCPGPRLNSSNDAARRARRLPGWLLVLALSSAAAEEAPPDEQRPSIGRMGEPVRVDPGNFEFSRAETLLWMSDHLSNVQEPVRLRYDFSKRGSLEENFNDQVLLDVRALNEDGSKDTHLDFFSADRTQKVDYSDNLSKVRGNPVLGIYLRGDVHDMNRLTDGHWRYFQRQIKLALADRQATEQIELQLNGRSVPAEVVRILPYAEDEEHRAELKEYAGKYYEFIFSEEVPGALYQIHTMVPNPEGSEPLLEEILIFSGQEKL